MNSCESVRKELEAISKSQLVEKDALLHLRWADLKEEEEAVIV